MKKFIGILLVLCFCAFLFGEDQEDFPDIYIDESVAPGGVGSEADPYSDFSEINWTTGGDNSIFDWYAGEEDASVTINLQRGETWLEQLSVNNASGTATYPIIIQAYGSGNKPVIDAELTRFYCIYVISENYITIDGLELKDATRVAWEGACVRIDGGSTEVIVKNCDIYHPQSKGIDVIGCSNCTVEDNLIDTTPIDNAYEADGIYLQDGSGGHIIRRNIIYLKADGTYIDGIQTVNEVGFTIEYNWIENPTGYAATTGGSMLLQLENNDNGSGTFNVRYNVLFMDTNQEPAVVIDGYAEQTMTYNFHNNIIMNLAGGGNFISPGLNVVTGTPDDSYTFRNNIFYISNALGAIFNDGINAASQLDYNCWYRETGTDIIYDDTDELTWAEMRTATYEDNGINADPLFIDAANLDFRLLMASPCVDAGTDVSLTVDYRGRSIRHAPDIGAYEDPTSALFLSKLLNYIKEKRNGKQQTNR